MTGFYSFGSPFSLERARSFPSSPEWTPLSHPPACHRNATPRYPRWTSSSSPTPTSWGLGTHEQDSPFVIGAARAEDITLSTPKRSFDDDPRHFYPTTTSRIFSLWTTPRPFSFTPGFGFDLARFCDLFGLVSFRLGGLMGCSVVSDRLSLVLLTFSILVLTPVRAETHGC